MDSEKRSNRSRTVTNTPSFDDIAAAEDKSAVDEIHRHCAVFTRSEVARGILDFVDWRADLDLAGMRLLEPACGEGAFLLPAIARLVGSARAFGRCVDDSLGDRILAFEFDAETSKIARSKIVDLLRSLDVPSDLAERLSTRWLRCADFLPAEEVGSFSHIVGNPPYMRWSKLPKLLRGRYEAALPTYAARGDLCLSFVWKGVEHLRPGDGRLAFLCADRWLRCAYGSEARIELAKRFRVASHFEVHRVPVFDGERKVGAYAAITVLDQAKDLGGEVQGFEELSALTARLQGSRPSSPVSVERVLGGGGGGAVLAGGDLRSLFEAMSVGTVRLTDAGVEIRCGMALGVAEAFVVGDGVEIEKDRLVPYVRARDLTDTGDIEAALHVVDVWTPEGALVDLHKYPKLAAHLESYRKDLETRACVGRPEQWYRTIDRMRLERLVEPKILIAGMAKRSRVAWLPPGIQPGNALYTLTSREWPLRVLYALLRTGVLDVFATVLAPRFSGGSLRYDGNVLGQVRIPLWSSLDEKQRRKLDEMGDGEAMSGETVAELYGLKQAADIQALTRYLVPHAREALS